MAQAIRCDAGEDHALADLLITHLASGETIAFCDVHFAAWAESTLSERAAAADALATERLEGVQPGPGEAEPTVEPATVVRRGSSASRRRYAARQRAKAAAPADHAAEGPRVAPGPPGEPTEPMTEADAPTG